MKRPKNLNKQGFTVVEVLMILLVVVIVGAIGWYVWRQRNLASQNAASDSARSSEQQSTTSSKKEKTKTTTTTTSDASADWNSYKSKTGGFTIKVPDGWKLTAINGWLYGHQDSDVVDKSGTDGKVTETEFGWDGPSALTVMADSKYASQLVDGDKQGTITSNSGVVFTKYYQLVSETVQMGPTKGDKIYTYYANQGGKKAVIQRTFHKGDTVDLTSTELLVKSFKFN